MSARRRSTHKPARSNGSDKGVPVTTAQLATRVDQLQETIDELKTDVLMLTRKIVSLEAELDHVQGKRQLR